MPSQPPASPASPAQLKPSGPFRRLVDAARPVLSYHRGTLVLPAPPDATLPTAFAWDARAGLWRASAHEYASVSRALFGRVEDRVLRPIGVPADLDGRVPLRAYQETAMAKWRMAGERGVVVLPTGAGKTFLALRAFADLRAPTLVVTPTLDLVDQWAARFRQAFPRLAVATMARSLREPGPVTIATYDSAYLHADKVGDRFGLVVFDECHHLPSEGYRHIAEMVAAPARLGITATPEREDGQHTLLASLVGPVVERLRVKDLAGKHLAPFEVVRVEAALTPEERAEYEPLHAIWKAYVGGDRARGRLPVSHKRLVMRSANDPAARKALLARERARHVTFNAKAKHDALRAILERHRGSRVLVFTEYNRLVATISREFLVPALTHRTHPEERAEILARFRDGTYPVVVTSKVLDEGVDVPEASVAVILSGSGSVREFAQRLGRILRPGPGKRAILYEVVTADSAEERTSAKRRKALTGHGAAGAG